MGFTEDEPPLVNFRILDTNGDCPVGILKDMKPPKSGTIFGGASDLSRTALEGLGSAHSRAYLIPPLKRSTLTRTRFISTPTS